MMEAERGDDAAPPSMRGRRLFIRGLPYDWDRERGGGRELSKFGEVERLELPKARRGCGFVDYATERSASEGIRGARRTALGASEGRALPDARRAGLLASLRMWRRRRSWVSHEFSGRGSKAERQREKRIWINYTEGRSSAVCGTSRPLRPGLQVARYVVSPRGCPGRGRSRRGLRP